MYRARDRALLVLALSATATAAAAAATCCVAQNRPREDETGHVDMTHGEVEVLVMPCIARPA
jgi:hypothetical protein